MIFLGRRLTTLSRQRADGHSGKVKMSRFNLVIAQCAVARVASVVAAHWLFVNKTSASAISSCHHTRLSYCSTSSIDDGNKSAVGTIRSNDSLLFLIKLVWGKSFLPQVWMFIVITLLEAEINCILSMNHGKNWRPPCYLRECRDEIWFIKCHNAVLISLQAF